jgi:hypothetical protein
LGGWKVRVCRQIEGLSLSAQSNTLEIAIAWRVVWAGVGCPSNALVEDGALPRDRPGNDYCARGSRLRKLCGPQHQNCATADRWCPREAVSLDSPATRPGRQERAGLLPHSGRVLGWPPGPTGGNIMRARPAAEEPPSVLSGPEEPPERVPSQRLERDPPAKGGSPHTLDRHDGKKLRVDGEEQLASRLLLAAPRQSTRRRRLRRKAAELIDNQQPSRMKRSGLSQRETCSSPGDPAPTCG